MQKVSNLIYRGSVWLIVVLVGIMTVVTILDVIARSLFHAPFSWTGELAGFILVWLTFLGAGASYKKLEMPSFDLLANKVSLKTSLFIFKAIHFINILFCVILVYAGFTVSFSNTILLQTTPGLRISMTIPYLALPVGMFIILIHATSFLLHYKNDFEENTL